MTRSGIGSIDLECILRSINPDEIISVFEPKQDESFKNQVWDLTKPCYVGKAGKFDKYRRTCRIGVVNNVLFGDTFINTIGIFLD